MAFEFKLPSLGENIEQAEIVKVLVSVGDKVEVDQIIIEIETDKATVEVPSEFSGVVKSINIKDGDTVNIGDVIITYNQTNEAVLKEKKSVKEESIIVPPKEEKPKLVQTSGSVVEFKLPELGENIEQADIVNILVSVGDKVEVDQILLEIETDKATVEVPTEISGTIKEVKFKSGETAKVGDVIFLIDTGEMQTTAVETEVPEPEKPEQPIEEKIVSEVSNTETQPTKEITMPTKIAPAAPTVRRFAREIGVDINEVNGNGPGGRISIIDVKKFAKSINENIKSGGGSAVGLKKQTLPDFSKWGSVSKEPMSNVRKKTAEHLSYAWTSIPHVTQFDKADITELEKLRKQYSKRTEAIGGKLTITAVLLKIVASALKVFPQFNASIDMDNNELILKNYFNIGIAVDTEKGLIVPVVKNVDQKNIQELATNLSEISEKARSKKITIEEMQGGCFTISNLGGIGGTAFTPIVNVPEVAILGVSRGSYEPVYQDGKFVPRMILPLSLSYDHRIIDGADAARFLRWVISAIEQPFLLSLEG